MKKIFTFFPIAFLLMITVSCSSKKTDQQISKIDSLANIIDSVDIKFKEICKANGQTILGRLTALIIDDIKKNYEKAKEQMRIKGQA